MELVSLGPSLVMIRHSENIELSSKLVASDSHLLFFFLMVSIASLGVQAWPRGNKVQLDWVH